MKKSVKRYKDKSISHFLVDERKQESSQVLDAVRLGRLATRFLIEEVEKNELFTDELSKSYINRAKVSSYKITQN